MRTIARNLFRSATAVGMLSVLTLGLTSGAAHAGPTCQLDGTFFPPTVGVTTADVLSTAVGSCKKLGKSAFTGILTADLAPDVNGCVAIVSNGPSIAVNKKGDSISYTLSGTQCLKDSTGQVPTTAGFCGVPTDTFASVISAIITITGGTGKKAGATGSGTISGAVDHCDSSAPFGNSFHAEIAALITP